MTEKKEPKLLIKGREFHRKLQDNWQKEASGEVEIEKYINKSSGKKGRIDIFIKVDETLVAIGEIKFSDWDSMSQTALGRNVKRQACQIWSYIDSQLDLNKSVSPGILFPKRPRDLQRINLIEQLFEREGISVVWEDESIEDRKSRN